jgi:tetratricopeptide (TPR) repeat protein
MALDHYSLCPCGSGKKIKFCCSNDILPELEKIVRAIEGDQRNSAVDQLTHLMEYKGKRPALLALKAEIQLSLEDAEGATQTAQEFLQRDPTSLLALSLATLAAAQRGDIVSAVQKVHKSLELVIERKTLDSSFVEALDAVGNAMLEQGDVMGARAYFMLMSVFGSGDDGTPPTAALSSIDRNPSLVCLLKQDFVSRDCPPNVVWKGEFDAAKQLMENGSWWKACEAFEQLSTRYSAQPSILFNLAVLRSRLGNTQLGQSAWRAYSSLPSVPLEEAAEALATARILDTRNEDMIDSLSVEIPLSETDRVMERLLSDKRFLPDAEFLQRWDREAAGPPPKGVFQFLDRPLPAASPDVTIESLPLSQALVLVFGRQTDRSARIELSLRQSPQVAEVIASLRAACGDSAGEATAPVVAGKISALNAILEPMYAIPPGLAPEVAEKLYAEIHRRALMEVWPKRSWKSLDGKKPLDVAGDPAYRVRLCAEVLLLEMRHASREFGVDFNQLRTLLGLPTLDPIEASELDVHALPLPRLGRVVAEKLDDTSLTRLIERANYYGLVVLARKVAPEVLRRESLRSSNARLVALTVRATSADSFEEAVQCYRDAAELAGTLGRSAAPYLLGELQIQLLVGTPERVMEIVQIVQSRYGQDPNMMQALSQILGPFLGRAPDGRMTLRMMRPGAATGAATGGAAPAAKPASGLWTPGQGSPAAPAAPVAAPPPAAKSKLWVPGMD